MALTRGARAVALVGDHKQLPPTVLSRDAEARGMKESLFDRLQSKGVAPVMLDTQFRMHPALAAFPCAHFYGGKLRSGTRSAARVPPCGFPWPSLPSPSPVAFVPVPDGREVAVAQSWQNELEVSAAMTVVASLLAGGELTASQIGVIAPYSAQVRALRNARNAVLGLGNELEISSVDGFQGREKEAVVFTATRSSEGGARGVGFLADPRRVNVMLTRAKRGLVVIGAPETLRTERKVWGTWLRWAHASGVVMLPGGAAPAPHESAGGDRGHGADASVVSAIDADDVAAEDATAKARRVLAAAELATRKARDVAEARAARRREDAEKRARVQAEARRAFEASMRESKSTTSVADGEEGKEKEKKVRGPRGGKKVKSAAAAAVVATAAAIPAGSDVGAPPPPPPPPGAPTDGSRLDDGAPPPAPPLVDTPYLRETIAAATAATTRAPCALVARARAAAAAAAAALGGAADVAAAVADRASHHALHDRQVRSIHWSPYDPVGVVNAVP